jgi:hypothetical protein
VCANSKGMKMRDFFVSVCVFAACFGLSFVVAFIYEKILLPLYEKLDIKPMVTSRELLVILIILDIMFAVSIYLALNE